MKTLHYKELIKLFNDFKCNPQEKFCFLLGAGASYSSGIPTGSELAWQWYEELKKVNPDELKKLVEQKNIDEQNLAEFYQDIYAFRFRNHPNQGYCVLQNFMEKAQPKIGYVLLAQILNKTQHKFVITTNFDYLMEDALRFYTDTHPLVCGHESLAPYISLYSSRPVIMKVHRDLLLEPLNKREEVVLKKQWKKVIKLITENHSLIVLGYGGNDTSSDKQGLMDYLKAIKKRKPIYWCYRKDDYPNQDVIKLLKYHKYDCLVEIEDFDRFITQLAHNILESEIIYFKYPNESFIVRNATEKAEKYLQEFNKFLGDTIDNDKYDKHQWAWLWRIKVDSETDKDEKRKIYQKAISILPYDVKLLLSYVSFLASENDINEADSYIRQALTLEPNNANIILGYALFLHENRNENFKKVQPYYLRALDLKPNDTEFNYYYAEFLKYYEHYTEAEHYYLKTLELDANHLNANSSYSLLLHTNLKDYDKAKIYYLKYLQLEPNDENINGNYAQLLLIKGKKDQAESYLIIALASDKQRLIIRMLVLSFSTFPRI